MDNRDDTPQIAKKTRKTRVTRQVQQEEGVEDCDDSAPIDECALFSPVLNETDSWDTVGGSDQTTSAYSNETKLVHVSVMQSLRESAREDEQTNTVFTPPRRSQRPSKKQEESNKSRTTDNPDSTTGLNLVVENESDDDDLQYDEKEVMRQTPNVPPSARVMELMSQNLLNLGMSPPVEPSPRNTPVDRPESRALTLGEALFEESPKIVIADVGASPVYLVVESERIDLSGLEVNREDAEEPKSDHLANNVRNANKEKTEVNITNREPKSVSNSVNDEVPQSQNNYQDLLKDCVKHGESRESSGLSEEGIRVNRKLTEKKEPEADKGNDSVITSAKHGENVQDNDNLFATKYVSLLETLPQQAESRQELEINHDNNVAPIANIVENISPNLEQEFLGERNPKSDDERSMNAITSQVADGERHSNTTYVVENEIGNNLEVNLSSDFDDDDADKENDPVVMVLANGTMVEGSRLVPYNQSDIENEQVGALDEASLVDDGVQTPTDERPERHPKSPPKLPVRRVMAPLREIELPIADVAKQSSRIPTQGGQLVPNEQDNNEIPIDNAEQQSEIHPVMHSTAFDDESHYLGEMIDEPPMTDQERLAARLALRRRLFSASSSGQSSSGAVHKSRPKKGKRTASSTPKVGTSIKNKATASNNNRLPANKRENPKTVPYQWKKKAQILKELKEKELEKQLKMTKKVTNRATSDQFNDSPLQYFLETNQMQCFGLRPAVVVVSKAEPSSYPQSSVQYAHKPPECPIAVIAKELMAMQVADGFSKMDNQNAIQKCQQRCLSKLNANRSKMGLRVESSSENDLESES